MDELTDLQTEGAGGGLTFGNMLTLWNIGYTMVKDYGLGMGAVGGTLNNYYGADMTLEIIAAGNMGA